jgi:hypothetical protein
MYKPFMKQSTKMHKTYLKNGDSRGDTQERCKGGRAPVKLPPGTLSYGFMHICMPHARACAFAAA